MEFAGWGFRRGGRWVWVVGMLVAVLLLVVRNGRAVPQPIVFNHLKHTQDLQLSCKFCHKYVLTGRHAGLPDAGTCAICHRTLQGESAEAARTTELIAQGDPLYFNKLFSLADHVFYSHRRHVGIAGLACTNCHGDIADTERPPARPLVTMSMDYCIQCHEEQGVTVDCVACHR